MQIQIKERAQMWFIPGKIHLTFEERSADVDLDTLTDAEVKQVYLGIKMGSIYVDDLNALNARLGALAQPAPQPVTAPKSQPVTQALQIDLEAKRKETLEKVDAILKGDLASIKKLLRNSSDMLFLRLMKEQELLGKARKGILSDIDKCMLALQKPIEAKVGKEDVATVKVKTGDLEDHFDVEDSDEKTVTIGALEQTA